jgi:hypothetical protein
MLRIFASLALASNPLVAVLVAAGVPESLAKAQSTTYCLVCFSPSLRVSVVSLGCFRMDLRLSKTTQAPKNRVQGDPDTHLIASL